MIIFKNKDRNYLICGLEENVLGICNWTQPKVWMDGRVFLEYIEEKRENPPDQYGRLKTIYVENCSGHNDTPTSTAALERLNIAIRELPPNATNLCQPADYFIISKVKDAWKR